MSETPVETIEFDLPCTRCGYNLRGGRPTGQCPECGRSVSASVDEHVSRVRAVLENPETLARKARTHLLGICAGSVFALLSHVCVVGFAFYPADVLRRGSLSAAPATIVLLLAVALGVVALWVQGRAMSKAYRYYVLAVVAAIAGTVAMGVVLSQLSGPNAGPRFERLGLPLILVALLGCLDRVRCLARWLASVGMRWLGLPYVCCGFAQAAFLAFALAVFTSMALGKHDPWVGESLYDVLALFPTAVNGWPRLTQLAIDTVVAPAASSLEIAVCGLFLLAQFVVILGDAAVLFRSRHLLHFPPPLEEEVRLATLLSLKVGTHPSQLATHHSQPPQ